MASATAARKDLLLIGFSTAILLSAAVYNGFPLLFPDTGAYMNVAYGRYWTMDRSGFYGLFIKPIVTVAEGTPGLWAAVAVQASIVAGILVATLKRMLPETSPLTVLALIAGGCMLTSLPWHAGQLMPDAFAGPIILLAWFVASRDFDGPGTLLLWFAAALLVLTHYTYLALFAASAATTIVLCRLHRVSVVELTKRAIAAMCVFASVIGAHVAANGIVFDRWTLSPMGSWFLFARLNEDGLVPAWLDRHCGKDAPEPLCELRDDLPRDSQVLLWSRASPLYPYVHAQFASPTYWKWMEMLGEATAGSLKEQPLAFSKNAIIATGRQLTSFATLDDECPSRCATPSMMGLHAEVATDIRESRQIRDTIPRSAIRAITGFVAALALLMLLPFMVLARRRDDTEALILLSAIAVSLVTNAAFAGALSDVHDRYQSRVVWIVPFVELILILRWRGNAAGSAGISFQSVRVNAASDATPEPRRIAAPRRDTADSDERQQRS